jgi:hypothetical protein
VESKIGSRYRRLVVWWTWARPPFHFPRRANAFATVGAEKERVDYALVRKKGQRIGRNPKTGTEVSISRRRVMVFKPSAILKQRIKPDPAEIHC